MLHAEMVLVVPVLAFTFLVMGWIISQFRGYLKRREVLMAEWEARVAQEVAGEYLPQHIHREAA